MHSSAWKQVEKNVYKTTDGDFVNLNKQPTTNHWMWFDKIIERERVNTLGAYETRALSPSGVRVLTVLCEQSGHLQRVVSLSLAALAMLANVNVRTLPSILRRLARFGCIEKSFRRNTFYKDEQVCGRGTTCYIRPTASVWASGRGNQRLTIKVAESAFVVGLLDYAPHGGQRKGAGRKRFKMHAETSLKTTPENRFKTRADAEKRLKTPIRNQRVANQNTLSLSGSGTSVVNTKVLLYFVKKNIVAEDSHEVLFDSKPEPTGAGG